MSALIEMEAAHRINGRRKPQRGTHDSREVQLHTPQRDRGGKFLLTTIWNNSSHNRGGKGEPNPKHEDASKHRNRVDYSCPRPKSKERSAASLPQ